METWAQLSLRFDSGTDIQAKFPEDVRPKEREMCGGINCLAVFVTGAVDLASNPNPFRASCNTCIGVRYCIFSKNSIQLFLLILGILLQLSKLEIY